MSDAPVATSQLLQVSVAVLLKQVPTAVYFLYMREEQPLVRVDVTNVSAESRTVLVSCLIQGYTVEDAKTLELNAGVTASALLLPVFNPPALRSVTELTPASVSIKVSDLNTGLLRWAGTDVIWLLSRNSAPVRALGESAEHVIDLLPLLGAFVTENAASVQAYVAVVARCHPRRRLLGYYAAGSGDDSVRSQVRALYRALNEQGKLSYAPALVVRQAEGEYQRVRLPRECLDVGLANCLEGVLLFCSLLEAMGLQSAIVWTPEHAVVAWKEDPLSAAWFFLDTTKVGPQGELPEGEAEAAWGRAFEQAMEWGSVLYEDNQDRGADSFRILPIRDLRAQGITPLE